MFNAQLLTTWETFLTNILCSGTLNRISTSHWNRMKHHHYVVCDWLELGVQLKYLACNYVSCWDQLNLMTDIFFLHVALFKSLPSSNICGKEHFLVVPELFFINALVSFRTLALFFLKLQLHLLSCVTMSLKAYQGPKWPTDFSNPK